MPKTITTHWGHTLTAEHATRFRVLYDLFAIQGPRFNRHVRDALADVLLSHDDEQAAFWLDEAETIAVKYRERA